jgi:hypothetical protein
VEFTYVNRVLSCGVSWSILEHLGSPRLGFMLWRFEIKVF